MLEELGGSDLIPSFKNHFFVVIAPTCYLLNSLQTLSHKALARTGQDCASEPPHNKQKVTPLDTLLERLSPTRLKILPARISSENCNVLEFLHFEK